MKNRFLNVNDKFQEMGTVVIDDHKRISVAKLIGNQTTTVRMYMNSHGEIFLQPISDIPHSEQWLFRNEKAIVSVRNGLRDAAEGKISKLDPGDLEDD
ncbi:MAG: hypothetical protein DRI57_16290 [Deltaproteobacteria bacterium]|nr:MAG: hypothetical protein DRI57_16290 [Deltaproteobacteria bacterium]